jgi:curli biogenesis system outer membrane secretion channel CsgG
MFQNKIGSVFVFIAFGLSPLYLPALVQASHPAHPVRVSVLKFTDRTARGASYGSGCHGYYLLADSLGNAFADLLVERLHADPKLEVLERDAIDTVYSKEVDLVNSESDHSIKKGRFKKARIAFVGVVDSFEYCESGSGAALNVGRIFGVGDITPSLRTSKASVSILIRAVDTTTGKILATARAKKEQSKRSVGLRLDTDAIDFKAADFRQSPLGEAIRAAVNEASDGILKRLKI